MELSSYQIEAANEITPHIGIWTTLTHDHLERHVTLDRTMWGSDHMCSLEPQGLFKLVSGIRELEQAHGDGEIKVTDSEKPVRKKLRG